MKQIYLKVKDYLCMVSSDKYLHCIVSLVMVQLLISIPGIQLWLAISIVLGCGVVKEIFDKYVMKTLFDIGDLKADCIGTLLGAVLAMLLQ